MERIDHEPLEQPNQLHSSSSESTIPDVHNERFGYQDTYGESNANQVSVQGIKTFFILFYLCTYLLE